MSGQSQPTTQRTQWRNVSETQMLTPRSWLKENIRRPRVSVSGQVRAPAEGNHGARFIFERYFQFWKRWRYLDADNDLASVQTVQLQMFYRVHFPVYMLFVIVAHLLQVFSLHHVWKRMKDNSLLGLLSFPFYNFHWKKRSIVFSFLLWLPPKRNMNVSVNTTSSPSCSAFRIVLYPCVKHTV